MTVYLCEIYLLFRFFGFLLIIAGCKFKFITKHFKFLTSVVGKGLFNCFLASMFLVGSGNKLYGWIMLGGLLTCGVFFILVGCACIEKDGSAVKRNKALN